MSPVLRHPLFLLLVGVVFSAGFVPWVTRHWQNEQRALDIRTGLVAEMSACVMQFVAHLEHFHSRHQPGPPPAVSDNSKCPGLDDTLIPCYREFHVVSCIIGTKLEVYYPMKAGGERISAAWRYLADSLLELSTFKCHDTQSCVKLETELNGKLYNLKDNEKNDAIDTARHQPRVDESWGRPEQLLLAEKARLIRTVLRTRISPQSHPRRFPSLLRRFRDGMTGRSAPDGGPQSDRSSSMP
jgi:hypothetical protein